MAARVTEAMRTAMAALPQHPAADSGRSRMDKAREAAFAAALARAAVLPRSRRPLHARSRARGTSTLGPEPGALLGAHWTTVVTLDRPRARCASRSSARVARAMHGRGRAAHGDRRRSRRIVHWTLVPGTSGELVAGRRLRLHPAPPRRRRCARRSRAAAAPCRGARGPRRRPRASTAARWRASLPPRRTSSPSR